MKRLGHQVQLATELGLTMGLMAAGWTVLGLWLGIKLDARLGTQPIATLLLLLAGAAAGQLSLIRLVARARPQLSADAPHAFSAAEGLRTLRMAVLLLMLLIVPITVGLLLGVWLDDQLGTRPVLTLVLALAGMLVGLFGVLRIARSQQPVPAAPAVEQGADQEGHES